MEMRKFRQPLGIQAQPVMVELAARATLDRFRLDPRTRVTNENSFREMQIHVENLYRGVQALHSFEDSAGRVFDCVPINEQPSLRGYSGEIPRAPDLNPVLQGRPAQRSAPSIAPMMREEVRRDRHGNLAQAPPGTIPIRRVTLDELVRFPDLRSYFRKEGSPRQYARREAVPTGPPPSLPDPSDTRKNHRYAYTHQDVDNIGGHSSLAVYQPTIDANQIFSLAQHWYSGGSGNGHQTLELGWQVYPNKYGHAQPVFFIYWTADNYINTGAYNLDAAGFVQTNGAYTVGGALSPVSTKGGQQWEVELGVYLWEGNWWVYMGGLAPENAVGYYPTSIYAGGQLATSAQQILYGGETVCKDVSWPGMGSGSWAADGWMQAAYQRNIYYFPPGGGAQWASLTPEQPSPACYSMALASAAAPWGVYFFYGGPGGGDC
jgi:hypothetical protein